MVEKLKSSIWSNIVWNSRSTQWRAKKDRSWNESPAGILFLNATTTGYVVGNERCKCQSDFGSRNSLSVQDQRIQRTTLFAVSRNAALSGKSNPSIHTALISARENVMLSNGLQTFNSCIRTRHIDSVMKVDIRVAMAISLTVIILR